MSPRSSDTPARGIALGLALLVPTAAPASGADPEAKALEYLAREVPAWREEHACGSCHNNGDAARALLRARRLGRKVPDESLANTLAWLREPPQWEQIGDAPERSDSRLARLQFAAALVEAEGAGLVADPELLGEVAAAVARDQDDDGAWRIAELSSMGSPVAWGPFVATWQARRTLRAADPQRFASEAAAAEAWLIRQTPMNVMDAAAALLALADSDAPDAAERRRQSRDLILEAQASSGGWGPWPRTAADVFDTALAVLALVRTEPAESREAIARGRAWLVEAQLAPGGWPETTRPAGYLSYAQHVSTSGWATLALLESAEPATPPGTEPTR